MQLKMQVRQTVHKKSEETNKTFGSTAIASAKNKLRIQKLNQLMKKEKK